MKPAAMALLAFVVSLPAQEIPHPYAIPPKVIRQVTPKYTEAAVRAKIEGTAIVSAVAGVDGVPSEIKVVRELDKGLDEKAVDCVRQWRFRPGSSNGEPVPVEVTIEVNFRLPVAPPDAK